MKISDENLNDGQEEYNDSSHTNATSNLDYVQDLCEESSNGSSLQSDDLTKETWKTANMNDDKRECDSISCTCHKHDGSHDSVSESDTETFRQTLTPKKTFVITINEDEWAQIQPSADGGSLKAPWTKVFSDHFSEFNKCCFLKFVRNKTKKSSSSKTNAPFGRCVAQCKFSGCAKYIFTIEKPTSAGCTPVLVEREGKLNHKKTEIHKRHTRKPEREKIAAELEKTGTSEYFKKIICCHG